MKILKYKDFLLESKNIIKLFHGTSKNKFKREDNLIFLSEDSEFAKSYGEKVYIIQVDLGNIFDSLNIKHIKKLYKAGFKLTDPYISDWGEEVETYDYDNEEYPTAEDFIESTYSNDTWNPIESTDGVIDWILSNNFDSILITESGINNYIVNKNRILKK
jgi:hypothetical protein